MAYINSEQVRARLRTLNETDVPDELLEQASYIPAGDAWLDMVLSEAGKDFSTLSDPERALAVAAGIAFVAHKVVAAAPVRGSKSGPIEIRPVSEADKERLCAQLRAEWSDYLRLLGCSEKESWWSGSFGGSTYD